MNISSTLLVGLTVLSGALVFKTYELGGRLTEETTAAALRASEAEEVSRGLTRRLQALRPPPYSLRGIAISSGEDVVVDSRGALVVYTFGPNCPFSPRNVAFLNRIHAAGVGVIGLAPGQRRPLMDMFRRGHDATFPFIAYPNGTLMDILPRGAVPLTAVFLDDHLKWLWLGPLSEDRQRILMTELGIEAS